MKTIAKILFASVLIAAFGIAMTPQSAYDLFQKALTKEKAEGSLEEAIALFQQVVDKGEDESLAAQAQLHIGICHEKLGLGKARESYQKVIDRYPKQTESVKAAREKLTALADQAAKAPGSREINIRRVYDGEGPEWGNALSSDGRYLVYTDWETGDMAVVDLITREHRRLTHEGGLKKTSGDMGETSSFSPDNRRIAYGWMIGSKIAELRSVNFDGTDPKVLFRDETAIWIRPHEWSPDGKTVYVLLMRKDGSSDIAAYSLGEDKPRIIRHVEAKDPEMNLSPDGKMIAYSAWQEKGSSKRDIFLMKTDGTGHVPIVTHTSDDLLLGWAPNGSRVVFASDRSGSYGIWSVAVKDGKASGNPQWLKGDVTPSPVRLTPDGTLNYILTERLTDIYTVTIDPGSGKLLGQPAPVKSRFPGTRGSPDWSPDGTRLAYKFFTKTDIQPAGPASISVLDMKSGEEQLYETGLKSQIPISGPYWSPDGRSVLFIGMSGETTGIYKIEIPSGQKTLLVNIPPHQFCFFALWTLDQKSIIYHQGNPVRIMRHDLEENRDVELAKAAPAGLSRIGLSPDGKQLAFTSYETLVSPWKICLVSPAGGASREIYSTKAGEVIQWFHWTPDGREIWLRKFTRAADEKSKPATAFLSISPDGRIIRTLDPSLMATGNNSIHSDGRQLAYEAGAARVELWALENFLK